MTKELRKLAEAAQVLPEGDFTISSDIAPDTLVNYIAAANPQAILALIDRLEKAEADRDMWRKAVVWAREFEMTNEGWRCVFCGVENTTKKSLWIDHDPDCLGERARRETGA